MEKLLALNTDLSAAVAAANGKAPEWIELIPAGPTVTGRDGRSWLFDEAAQALVLNSFKARAIDLPGDWEHASHLKAPEGGEAPASTWIDKLDVRADGSLWGHAKWTPRAEQQVLNREYRFISPVFDFDEATGRITRLVSIGLTNRPNLFLTALNRESTAKETPAMDELLKLLGLPAGATPEQVLQAVQALQASKQEADRKAAESTPAATPVIAANAEQPSLDRYVPRPDYDALQQRALNAEQALAAHKKTEHDKAVDTLIKQALDSRKITPATESYHRLACNSEEGLKNFSAFLLAAPVIAPDSGLDGKKPGDTGTALNAEEMQVCKLLGLTPEEYAQAQKSQAQAQ